jgi:hypothetical protein
MYCTGCGRPIDIPISPDQKIETAESEKTMTKTRLIREDELELKVGDTVVKRNGIGYGYSRTVIKIDIIPNTGVRVWTGPACYDWYQDLIKETTVKRVETHTDLVHTFLEAPHLEVLLPEKGVFKPGDKVYYRIPGDKTGDYYPGIVSGVRNTCYDGTPVEAGWEMIDLKSGGFVYLRDLRHEWELEEDTKKPSRGIFKRGDEVYWDTAQTALTPKAHRRYEVVGGKFGDKVMFQSGGWAFEGNVHHLYEENE